VHLPGECHHPSPRHFRTDPGRSTSGIVTPPTTVEPRRDVADRMRTAKSTDTLPLARGENATKPVRHSRASSRSTRISEKPPDALRPDIREPGAKNASAAPPTASRAGFDEPGQRSLSGRNEAGGCPRFHLRRASADESSPSGAAHPNWRERNLAAQGARRLHTQQA
jgi:hypothetical protein